MKILMVGAGAVGQVFGLHLQKAGVELAFYARPGSADRLKKALEKGGLPLYQISCLRRRHPLTHSLEGFQVVTDLAGARLFKPDQIWFTTPSPVYHSGWFRDFLQNVPSKRVVCFAPEGRRPEFVPEGEDGDRFVFGGITLIAWQGDLDAGGGRPEGVNYWLPPTAIPLMGAAEACREVVELLKKGELRAAVKEDDFQEMQASGTALLSAFVAGLELAGWSFMAYRKSPWLKRAAHGAREAIVSQLGKPTSLTRWLLRIGLSSAVLYLATLVLPAMTPFDLEKYLKFHYLKTREQTLSLLDLFARDGIQGGLPVENLEILLEGLRRSS